MRLSDLGVAAKLERHFSCAEGFAKLERRNTFVGSPAFIAPELLTGIEKGYVASEHMLCIVYRSIRGIRSDISRFMHPAQHISSRVVRQMQGITLILPCGHPLIIAKEAVALPVTSWLTLL